MLHLVCLFHKKGIRKRFPFKSIENIPMQVHVEGVIRESEKPSTFVPENSPSQAEWYWLDAPTMARAVGLPPDTPMVEARLLSCPTEAT